MMGTDAHGCRAVIVLAAAMLFLGAATTSVAADGDQRDTGETCRQSLFRVAGDADVASGRIVDGPYSTWPVIFVGEAGRGAPVGADIPVPAGALPFAASPTGALGLGQAIPPVPSLVHFQVADRLPAGTTFATDRQTLILLAPSARIVPDSCR